MKSLYQERRFAARASSGLQVRDASTEAATALIKLVDMKGFLRVDHDADDLLITNLLEAVTQRAEQHRGECFRKRTIVAYWERFGDYAELPRGPHRSITKVEIRTTADWTEMDETAYVVTGDKKFKLALLSPTGSMGTVNAAFTTTGLVETQLRVTFEAGYKEAEEEDVEGEVHVELPKQAIAAIQDSVAFMYENRGELQVEKGARIEGVLTPIAKSMLDSMGG